MIRSSEGVNFVSVRSHLPHHTPYKERKFYTLKTKHTSLYTIRHLHTRLTLNWTEKIEQNKKKTWYSFLSVSSRTTLMLKFPFFLPLLWYARLLTQFFTTIFWRDRESNYHSQIQYQNQIEVNYSYIRDQN